MLLSLLTLLPVLLPTLAQDAPRNARLVNADTSLHCFYDKGATVVAILPQGTPVKVVREKQPWSRVYIPGGLDVWVHSDFVEQVDGTATVSVPRLNARPLPNTGNRSQVLGVLKKGMQVQVLLEEDGWLRVRAKEEDMGAWVLTANLYFDSLGDNWASDWKTVAEKRAVVSLPTPVVPDATPELKPTDSSTEKTATESANADGDIQVTAEPSQVELPEFLSADVAKDPHAHLLRASIVLARMAAEVPRDLSTFDTAKLDHMEMIFSTIIWHSSVQKDLDDARTALGKIDALRRFYDAALAAEGRRAALANEALTAEAAARARAHSAQSRTRATFESYIEVGWLEFHPGVNRTFPFAVSRSGRTAVVHSFDGRYNLRDFVGREVAIRGVWREASKMGAPRTLAVTELRVLPLRKTTTPQSLTQ
ncbi:MAG: SH3 domain-containing protein [Planctomycetes bacterium]|jgi:SH3-like domain-containing protein|nr:SH3 domain-containing protein [Planctomycetota bacterium]MBT4028370.1 SH3 domain-containing protein [Planctomycetota bacterium]MBT4561030.1 SH3 domain-containing protein [Planctomycetota bacterium]MBT7012763.1 SH3 domain-containing protein [Planctomycetota bacterium]MBT7319423.1 SH3 domain-containing protein [Planctomycetota bacterium]